MKGLKKNNKGSTLVEVIVGFSILMLCLAMLHRSTMVSFHLQDLAMENKKVTQAKYDMLYMLKPIAAWGVKTSVSSDTSYEVNDRQYNVNYKESYGTTDNAQVSASGEVSRSTPGALYLSNGGTSIRINKPQEITYRITIDGENYNLYGIDSDNPTMPFGYDTEGNGPEYNGNESVVVTTAPGISVPGISDYHVDEDYELETNSVSWEWIKSFFNFGSVVHEVFYYKNDDGSISYYALERTWIFDTAVTELNMSGNYQRTSQLKSGTAISLKPGDILIYDEDKDNVKYYYWFGSSSDRNRGRYTTLRTISDVNNQIGDYLLPLRLKPGATVIEEVKTPGEPGVNEDPGYSGGIIIPETQAAINSP